MWEHDVGKAVSLHMNRTHACIAHGSVVASQTVAAETGYLVATRCTIHTWAAITFINSYKTINEYVIRDEYET